MANVNYSAILAILNQAGYQKKEPAIYQAIKALTDSGQLTVIGFNADFAALHQALDNTFIFGTESERANYKPVTTVGNLTLFYATDTGLLWAFIDSENNWFPIGAPVDATYLTWTDESARLPNSRELLAGTGITFDDTVPNERTVNGSSAGGFVPMCTGEYPAEIMLVGMSVMMITYTGT